MNTDNQNTYHILGQRVFLSTEELSTGILNTVAKIDLKYYYLGSDLPTLESAIKAYESIFDKKLTDQEFATVILDNHALEKIIASSEID
jgi:hypothetical protein